MLANFGSSRFDKIVAENIRKSKRKAATEMYKASVGAAGKIATARISKPRPTVGSMSASEGESEAGRMARARIAAGVERAAIGQRATAATETARLKGKEIALGEEAFEFEKDILRKKKKKSGAVEEIEEIAASPRY